MNAHPPLLVSKHFIVTFFGASSIFLSLFNQVLVPLKIDRIQPYIAFSVVFTGLLSLFFWLNSNGLSRLDKKTKVLFKWWLICLIVMASLPLVYYHTFKFSNAYFGQGLSQDYLYVIYITLAFVFVDPLREKAVDSLFLRVSQLALITGLIAIVISDVSAAYISERSNAWTLQYHLWWISCAIFSYCYYNSFVNKRNKILGYAVLLVYIVFGIIVLKRAVIINSIVLLLGTLLLLQRSEFGRNSKRAIVSIRLIISVSFVVAIFYLLIPSISIFMHERFSTLFSDISDWDRRIEAVKYFENQNLDRIILGNGLNNYFVIEINGKGLPINALHIGILNMVYKGGILLLLFTLMIVINLFKLAHSSSLPSEGLIALGIGFSFLVSLSYELSFGYPPIIFFYLVPILRGFKYIK